MDKRSTLIVASLLSLLPIHASALSSDIEQPVNIESDTAEFNQEAGTASYQGNVIAKQGSLEISAQSLDIKAPDNELQTITSQGNPATFKQIMDDGKLADGKAQTMTYQIKQKKMILNGNAELKIDQDIISSEYIEYFVENGELRAGKKSANSKGQRVKAVFHPSNKSQ